jgi:hypothetical protein
MNKHYTNYYFAQVGGAGLHDIGPIYAAPYVYQRGSGIGSFFSGLIRSLNPLISSGLNAIRNQSIKTGGEILKNVGSKPFKDILK